jgi:hypothetical protein
MKLIDQGRTTMAEVRKSATQAAARKRAREKAATFREKQDQLEQLAADYFVATDTALDIRNTAEHEIVKIRARAEKEAQAVLDGADKIICQMLDLGTPKAEVIGRLGIANRHIRHALTTHASPARSKPAVTEEAEGTAGSDRDTERA